MNDHPQLAVNNLTFRYQDNIILKNLTMDFSAHQVTGIIGANGCGKSTLFMNLSGILKPQSGLVLWRSAPLKYDKKSLQELRKNVTTVFQDPDMQIFYTDVDSDIAFALRNLGVEEEEIKRRANEALHLVDALAFRDKPVQHLSFGQKKRVAIAGALVMQSDYLLLDEPTAGLDPAGRQQMINLLARIAAAGKHIVISSHDIDLIYQVCDGIYVMSHGEVCGYGTPESVFLQKEMIAAAGLEQPWLVKLHCETGLPLCKTEQALFAQLQRQIIPVTGTHEVMV
ncbi:ATP-binding cassette domain-containing protein [Providencia stuartii]|uniref:ABC transporter ATP-binding protein n=1 Tax=Providencia stuartii TaxID=588 RepID=A0AAJ1JDX5_PROST|nr:MULTISPECIES: ATP-binding cassette domain-containing protein [Providencia]EMA3640665.1 ATP-binding cassette domain-containing protein [Providencia stuartii]MBW3099518.1 ATP-binding cassette domain-containing protein [Providencia stuartii]MCB5215733.1 ATP-binding cassette domain-containing protein [Providencia stuartii]MDE8749461.1 ATP-binding cassette domain-containing protein [Providencia thailandensis]MDE8769264.1 ATP-binding cassette domain-containing protein [Providencia thailandensis]